MCCPHTCICTHTHTRAHVARAHTHTHMRICGMHTHTYTNTQMWHTHTCTHMCTYTHTYTHTHMHTHTHAQTHTLTHTDNIFCYTIYYYLCVHFRTEDSDEVTRNALKDSDSGVDSDTTHIVPLMTHHWIKLI